MKEFYYCFLYVIITNSVHLQSNDDLMEPIADMMGIFSDKVINGVYDSTNSDCPESCNCRLFGLRSNITLDINCKKEIEKIQLPVNITDVLYTTTLNLKNIGLKFMPKNICNYKRLSQINLQHNKLNNSNEIEKLNCKGDRYLSVIDLSSNNLTKLKGDLGKIEKFNKNRIENFTFIAENNKINNLSPDFFKNVKYDYIFIYC